MREMAMGWERTAGELIPAKIIKEDLGYKDITKFGEKHKSRIISNGDVKSRVQFISSQEYYDFSCLFYFL